MPEAVKAYVRYIDSVSRRIGNVVMYLLFAMLAILLGETVARLATGNPGIWTVETSQFLLVGYYILGGSYTLLIGGHVRMDAFYDRWSAKKKALADIMTFSIIAIFLVSLIIWGTRSSIAAIVLHQSSRTIWAPPMAPIKITMVTGMVLMLLQAIAELFKDLATVRGKTIT